MNIRSTRTFATMEVSRSTYNEVRQKFVDAGYGAAALIDGAIDMHGVALVLDCADEPAPAQPTAGVEYIAFPVEEARRYRALAYAEALRAHRDPANRHSDHFNNCDHPDCVLVRK